MRPPRLLAIGVDDCRYALRQLKHSPLFAVVAIVTLALGIGANTAIFALADAAWLRPLPFREPDRLVMLLEQTVDIPKMAVSPRDFRDWTERTTTFDGMAAIVQSTMPFVGRSGIAEALFTQAVTTRFFDVLGVKPLLGRTFTAADESSRANVAVLSEVFWRDRLGADPLVVGKSVRLNDRPFTVIGVVPASIQLLPPTPNATGATHASQLWTIYAMPAPGFPREPHFFTVVARLKPGVTHEQARRDIARVADRLAREFPTTNHGHHASLEPLRSLLIGSEVRLTTVVLVGVSGCVLLLCCANVANLLVTRGIGRQREFAVRSAMGASPSRIASQLIIETLVLAVLGGIVGGSVAVAILRAAPSMVPAGLLPASVALSIDLRVLVFCSVAVFVVALLCGLAPARFGGQLALAPALLAGGRVIRVGGALRNALAIVQVAAAVLLLCGAGLLLRSLLALQDQDPGYRAQNIVTAEVNLPLPANGASRYSTADALRRYYQGVEREVRAIPGVQAAAWGATMPLDGYGMGQLFDVVGGPPRPPANRPLAQYQIVSAAYFSTLGIAIRRGRAFTSADGPDSPPVCIVNEAFVRRYLRGRDPIGVRLAVPLVTLGAPATVMREIVGVVRQMKSLPNETEPASELYVPLPQNPWYGGTLVVQPGRGAPQDLVGAIRAAAARVDPGQPILQIRTMEGIARAATSRWRFRAQLVGAFALIALTLAIIGIFGLLAYTVQQRTREFGLRLAVGARNVDIARLVLIGAARVAGSGAVVGLIAAGIFTRGMTTLLFGVTPLDRVSFSAAVVTLAITAMLASIGPLWRAMRVDPAMMLRTDS